MPVVQVTLMEGRSDEKKERLIAELTEAVITAIDAPRESIRVAIIEVPENHFGIGGVSRRRARELGQFPPPGR